MDSKKWVIPGLFAVMVTISAPAFAGQAGPVGWWELNDGSGETATDSSGCGNHGALKCNCTLSASGFAPLASLVPSMQSPVSQTPRPAAKQSESGRKNQWVNEHLLDAKSKPPFSFVHDGRASETLLAGWRRKVEKTQLDADRTQHIFMWTDPKSDLEVRCVVVDYADYQAVEWTVFLRNAGKKPAPILEQIQGLDVHLESEGNDECILNHNRGDTCGHNAFEPLQNALPRGEDLRLAPVGGRPTSLAFPYFNLQHGKHRTMIALGWPGQWAARFARDAEGILRVQGGQELTHLRLLPGEEVRAPLVALLFADGTDAQESQNLWRRWMFAHNLPRRNNQVPPSALAMWGGTFSSSEANQKAAIELATRNGVQPDYWWIDAGWYPGTPGPMGEWTQTGTWQPDWQRFPNGMQPVSELVHERGMKLILWFEVERVSTGTAWREHTDWLLAIRPEDRRFRYGGDIGSPQFIIEEAERNQIREDDRLFNLGKPEARRFLTDYISSCIEQWGIDVFRLDCNISPLLFWRAADGAFSPMKQDRQGITENRYVCGLLAFFDELLRRHPHLLIDSCASGGRRIDLETMRRTVVYTRSDYWNVSPTGDQCQTHGLSSWLPHYATTSAYDDDYRFKSNLSPVVTLHYDAVKKDQVDWSAFRRRMEESRSVAPYFYGDYYRLTEWSSRENALLAWQFHRPQQNDGIVQVFRRTQCKEASRTYRLRGLDPAAVYEVRNFDLDSSTRITGEKLMDNGLPVEIKDTRGAAVIVYKRD